MRVLKLCAVVTLVLAFSGVARADLTSQLAWDDVVIANNIGTSGGIHIQFNILDWSQGRSYEIAEGDVAYGESDVNDLNDAQGNAQGILPGGFGNEDSWSIVKVHEILVDELANPNSPVIWSGAVDQNFEIVGIVYGGVDVVVEGQSLGNQVVGTSGNKAVFFIQEKGTLDVTLGSGGRVAALANPYGIPVGTGMYTGAGFDALGAPLPAATTEMILRSTTPTDKNVAGVDVGRRAEFIPDITQPGSGVGESSEFMDIVAGAWQFLPFPELEADPFYFGPGLPQDPHDPRHGDSETGDLHQENTFKPYIQIGADDDWGTSSKDPVVGFTPIPEPLTMVSMFAALSVLGSYIRKRRTA